MTNSEFIKELGFDKIKEAPKLEHHFFPFYERILEFISEYEPKFIKIKDKLKSYFETFFSFTPIIINNGF
ncbi:MAG: hypothetical protein BAA00_01370 [Parageobacillus thermoglucosidasius]|uniref:Uncharacterized protein n=1 Tax=Caldibacillus debilis TaxID=301148 RepID=A0A150MDU3_9BACI|nr:hypothetical protein B4135_1096 [Caldibacillus debilis]MBO2482374.1 hypothetical protein [Bacillaceae bacterium]OUM85792.1 MAG: hypothetical protein BAA00_01370 [Parageobacillus thermoglucosidasius]